MAQRLFKKVGQQMLTKLGQQMLMKIAQQLFHTIATDGRLAGANQQMFLTYTIDYVTPGRFFFFFQDRPLYHYCCWSVLVPFGQDRRSTTSTIRITAEWRWLHLPPSDLQSSMSRLSLLPSSTSSPG